MNTTPPNKSRMPVVAGSSAVAVHVASRRWLNFLDGMDALVTSMIEMRKCRAEDFDAILPLLRQLYPDKPFDLPSLQRAYDRSLASDQLVFLCADCDQRVIGFGSLTIKSNLLWCETLIGYVSDMVVDRAYRSRGIGSQILDHRPALRVVPPLKTPAQRLCRSTGSARAKARGLRCLV
jgi:ribosomal protein S18 acetylase RimI-like enzyme